MQRARPRIRLASAALLLSLAALSHFAPAVSAETGYRLPWDFCSIRRVIQGWHGSFSHDGLQMQYAYDFNHRNGTPVRASKGGTVSHAKSGQRSCGGYDYRNRANYVTIRHGDGSATLYLHLRDVYVSPGQWVHQGRLIGTGGATGWTECEPHLHFQRQDQGGWIENSRPIYFDEYPGQQLWPGQPYRSLNGSGYCPYRDTGSGGPIASLMLMGLGLALAGGPRLRRRFPSFRGRGSAATGLAAALLVVGACTPMTDDAPADPAPDPPSAAVASESRAPSVQVDRDGAEAPLDAASEDEADQAFVEWPAPRSLDISPPAQAAERSEAWSPAEVLGLRVLVPPEWEILEAHPESRQGIQNIYQPIGRWEEFDEFGMTRTRRNDFVTIFAWSHPDPAQIDSVEALIAWEAALPDQLDFAGGGIDSAVEIEIDGRRAWDLRWRPIAEDPGLAQSVVLTTAEHVIWINIGPNSYQHLDPEILEPRWADQLAFLASLEFVEP